LIHLVINSRMKNQKLSEAKAYTIDTDTNELVDVMGFLTTQNNGKKYNLDSTAGLKAFINDWYGNIPKVYRAFQTSPDATLSKMNSLNRKTNNRMINASADNISEMAYQKPNFEKAWGQAKSNGFVSDLGLERWVELAQSGKSSKISKPSLDKVLDYDPMVSPKDNLKFSQVDMPIIIKTPMGDYHLLSGNAELKGIMNMHGNAKVWYIDGSKAAVDNEDT